MAEFDLEKANFCRDLTYLLAKHYPEVRGINYGVSQYMEIVTIKRQDSKVAINVTWDSKAAIMEEVARELCGERAKGRLESWIE